MKIRLCGTREEIERGYAFIKLFYKSEHIFCNGKLYPGRDDPHEYRLYINVYRQADN